MDEDTPFRPNYEHQTIELDTKQKAEAPDTKWRQIQMRRSSIQLEANEF